MSDERYDPIANPYAPGAGTPPPALVGRDAIIEAFDVALQRIRSSRTSQHQLITGLRGVGKTVLLGKLAALAQHVGYRVVRIEAVGGNDSLRSLLRQARRILEDLDRSQKVTRALRSIESVAITLAGTGVTVERTAATPDREALADVITDLATAAADHDLGVLLAIDEAQMIARDDLRRILAGVHRCGQDGLPLACVLAGLPNLVGDVARAATYAERMFAVADLGPLSPAQVASAIRRPASEIGVEWAEAATEAIIDRSDGFPFFVQTWAYHTWNTAFDEPISADDVERAAPHANHALDSSFFAARIARIPASEVAYVQGLSSLGPGPHRSGEVAAAMDMQTPQVAAFRERLIGEGIIYAPRYGWVEFAIPHFDEYVRRALPR
ncbi:MAG: ATP-binding protein [Ilumatobacter sp.]|uniref:ATP-binding protein n=1 Tax=Ilumatobacter sp. TaxID=1967498 RepID=UPI00263217ED|nr:ATP-binding protein [Ilumatobacter sp.]MDJ0770242.1 ATP-binding protein [Ilumatobacter sp.]